MEGFSCTMYHNVTYNSICIYIYWVCCFLQCVVQSPSKSSTTIKSFFFRFTWLIIVLILFSLGMCGTHFTMSVKVLHTYGKEAIGHDVCHMALRWKFCPKIVSSVSFAVFVGFFCFLFFFHCSSHFRFNRKQTSKTMLKITICQETVWYVVLCLNVNIKHWLNKNWDSTTILWRILTTFFFPPI